MASSVASSSLKSGTFAPAITTARGPPSASTRRERFTPFFPLSVGLGPTRSPQKEPCPSRRRRTRGLFEIPGPIGALSTSLQEGRALEGFGALVRAYYQDRAGSVADNPIGDTPFDGPPYPTVAPATHDDQVRPELLGQAYYLQVHRSHPEVRPCYSAPGDLHPPGELSEPLPGLLFDLLVDPAFVAERPWIALKETGYHSDVHHVQLGVSLFGQVHGPRCGQLCFFGAVGGQQDPRREAAHSDTLLSRRHPIVGPVLIVSRQRFISRGRRWHNVVSEGLRRLIHPSAWMGSSPKFVVT